jgi:hypothetical protein
MQARSMSSMRSRALVRNRRRCGDCGRERAQQLVVDIRHHGVGHGLAAAYRSRPSRDDAHLGTAVMPSVSPLPSADRAR